MADNAVRSKLWLWIVQGLFTGLTFSVAFGLFEFNQWPFIKKFLVACLIGLLIGLIERQVVKMLRPAA